MRPLLAVFALCSLASAGQVMLTRTPAGGLQPQAAVDAQGVLHLIYLHGDPGAADIYYVRKAPGAQDYTAPLRVNSQPGSATAQGTVRGAHLAVGKDGRVHVAWNGSRTAEPAGPEKSVPMLYARLNDKGDAFEPQRNLMQASTHLDGGGTVAADASGNVYVTWHGAPLGKTGEPERRVWIAKSHDSGKSFSRETIAYAEPTGACSCCGMGAFADMAGNLFLLYRAARESVHRDMYLLASTDQGETFHGSDIHAWNLNACPMSTTSVAAGPRQIEVAWETQKQVYFAPVNAKSAEIAAPIAAPGQGNNRKHPAIAINAKGETILVWTEGTGFRKGGSLAWQVFDAKGQPTAERGQSDGVPASSLAAVYANAEGGFTVVY